MPAKLLVGDDWFEAVPPNTVVDTAYEMMLRERANTLLPGFVLVQFRYLVTNDVGNCSPHLALIDQHCRSWWLVLLQTGRPPPESYYAQQAEILRSHRYGQEVAGIINERSDNRLRVAELATLLTSEMPGVFVILGHPPAPSQSPPNVLVGIAEIFRAPAQRDILRINGEQPRQPDERIGTLTRDRLMAPGLLRLVLRPGAAFDPGAQCNIDFEGGLGSWTVINRGGVIRLVPGPGVSLPADIDVFALFRSPNTLLRLTVHTS